MLVDATKDEGNPFEGIWQLAQEPIRTPMTPLSLDGLTAALAALAPELPPRRPTLRVIQGGLS